MKAELLFFGFICEHNLRIVTADHVGKLFRGMFLDSKIAKKYSCSQTKTVFETYTSSLRKASLSWEICCTYSSDNTSSMVGKNKSLLKLSKDAER